MNALPIEDRITIELESRPRQLFGDTSYKKGMWSQLWDYKHKTLLLSHQHQDVYVELQYVQYILNFLIIGLPTISAILISSQSEAYTTILFLNIISALLKILEELSGLHERIQNHHQASENYKFVHGEIERVMTIKRTTTEFKENLDILTHIISSFDINAPPIFNHIIRRTPLIIPPNLQLPISPIYSRAHSPDPQFQWTTNYPILSTHPILSEYYKDINNIGHYFMDEEGFVVFIDSTCCDLVGLKLNDILASRYSWVSKIHKDDVDFIQDQWISTFALKTVYHHKYRLVPQYGAYVYVVTEAYPKYSRQGVFKGYEGIILNISEDLWNDLEI